MIVIPLKEENRGGLTPEGYQIVPVLCYHHFAEQCDSSLCTPTSVFEQHMRMLKEEGYSVISTAELGEFLAFARPSPRRPWSSISMTGTGPPTTLLTLS